MDMSSPKAYYRKKSGMLWSEKLKAATTSEEWNAVHWHYLKDKHPQRESR